MRFPCLLCSVLFLCFMPADVVVWGVSQHLLLLLTWSGNMSSSCKTFAFSLFWWRNGSGSHIFMGASTAFHLVLAFGRTLAVHIEKRLAFPWLVRWYVCKIFNVGLKCGKRTCWLFLSLVSIFHWSAFLGGVCALMWCKVNGSKDFFQVRLVFREWS